MQCKRDTDYALRILYCLKEMAGGDDEEARQRMTLSEIAVQTKIARTMAQRICGRLCEKGIIERSAVRGSGEPAYLGGPQMLRRTLLEVIDAVEGSARLFAVFDRRTDMYNGCERELTAIQGQFEELFAAPLGELFGTGEEVIS